MSYTKRQLIDGAMDEIGLGQSAFGIEPDQLESALRRLDSMMAEWDTQGIKLGFPIPYEPSQSSLDQISNIPAGANEAVICNLAMKLSPGFGKVVMRETKVSAKTAFISMLNLCGISDPTQKNLPGAMPLGQGNRRYFRDYYNRFTRNPVDQSDDPSDLHYLG